MKKIRELPGELAEKIQVPGEIIPAAGIITVTAGRYALVQDHRGIVEYSEERIVLALKRGKLNLTGSNLQLKAMNGGELIITGRIQNVEWC